MTTAIIHLSDFHNVAGNSENHRVVVDALFTDLQRQLEKIDAQKVFMAFSGDLAQAGGNVEQYEDFKRIFDDRLCTVGIPKEGRICVPGNHDLSQEYVNNEFILHEGVVSQDLSEEKFNDFVLKAPNVLTEKFSTYKAFENDFSKYGIGEKGATGAGWSLTDEIGVFCLNTSLCSSGGLIKDGKTVPDKGRLKIDTRSLHAWAQSASAKWKVLVMHHPLHWLSDWSQRELRALLQKHFSILLHGHEHIQEKLHTLNEGKSLIECCAPALFSRKSDQLGYSIVTINSKLGPREIIYRQWTKHQTFVSGVDFSNNDTGKVIFHTNLLEQLQPTIANGQDLVLRFFNKRLDNALVSFSGQPKVWVEPVVKTKPEMERDEASIEPVDLANLIEKPVSCFIHALPQFGLTCLAHYLVKEAWEKCGDLWLYFDVNELKPGTVKDSAARELGEVGISHSEVKCLLVDSVSDATKDAWKIIERLIQHFPEVPVICMRTLDPVVISGPQSGTPELSIKFQPLYLWTLSRSLIRGIVSKYNDQLQIGDDNTVITKIVADLEMLNLHRTPLNCLTLLKVSEVDFDDSPVNRSEMIKRVLFLLFNADSLPTYKARPDLKDCEYVLGYFCETLVKGNTYTFSRTHFLSILQQCCKERFIDLEVHVVFDVLSANNILISRDGQFAFKFSFWIYYFAALRMHHDESFAKFILNDFKYANFPELIEFYTGIDRQREDATKALTRDLASVRMHVEEKCGLPKNMDPYRFAQWKPSETILEKMEAEIEHGVKESNLPAEIKDRFADRSYDPRRPYDQSVNILAEQSVVRLMQTLRAAAKALRNSDYVAPVSKRALLEEILRSWEQLTMVLLVVMPVLADKGHASFDGATFVLDGNFGTTIKEKVLSILIEIPGNVVKWSRDDLHSQKMGPLFLDVFYNESVDIRKHALALLLILQKPRGWREAIQAYIVSTQKNSFYLLDVYRALRTQYRFSYVSNATLKDIEHLIRMAATKHVTGAKEPGVKLIQKTIPKLSGEPIVPAREVP